MTELQVQEIIELRRLLGMWITHVRSQVGEGKLNGAAKDLVGASELTYAFVNATCKHQGLPPDPNNSNA